VLDPALRRQDKAQGIAQALTIKAAARLRRYELHAARVYLGVRTAEGVRWGAEQRLSSPAQDNFTILAALRNLWTVMAYDTHGAALKKLSISLYDLYKKEDITPDLFASAPSLVAALPSEKFAPKPLAPRHRLELSTAMDRLNRTYGAGTIHLGMLPKTSAGHVGTKIAFTRIPDKQEFWE
jgi:DNA polymerase-4